ncbi:putative anticodon-binding, Brix domain-containing protein [Rosa chinensis]|uniref:Putative anticodon-binding, Brix domain-containing protein n=1 Tax=Rosa chinensis TaxID=74649 RepID=A0A2P6QGE0_ROSCH|nr:putative anticodon-binding, Brix domain-containing protein [Rosa chinensis]
MCAKVYAFCCFGGFQRGPAFIEELLSVIPNAQYYKRDTYDLKNFQVVSYVRMDYLQAPNGFLLSPTFFRLIQSLFPQEPNFSGRRVVTFHNQRDFIFFRHHRCASFAIFSSCSDPFLYLYIFETKETKQAEVKGKNTKDSKVDTITEAKPFARLQECGPRFTLKLISLQHGTFDPRGGEFEWVHKVIHLSVNSFQYIGFISLS